MKSMTCRELGGACDKTFQANSFEEMAALSKDHAMQMLQKQDVAHVEAMQEMQTLMESPSEMKQWLDYKRKEFDALPQSE